MATTYHCLPIFPLPRLVMMPGSLLPLHVFEPRYRALVTHCMQSDGLMGVATLQPDSVDQGQVPPIYPEIGVGRLVRVKPFPDGRSNIVLSYVQTALLQRELPQSEPFRQVVASGIDVSAGELSGPISRLRLLVAQLGMLAPSSSDEMERLAGLDDAELLDDLAARVLESPDERRSYSATHTLADRCELLVGQLAHFLARYAPTGEA